jgi:hypothetical protein
MYAPEPDVSAWPVAVMRAFPVLSNVAAACLIVFSLLAQVRSIPIEDAMNDGSRTDAGIECPRRNMKS